MDALNLLLYSVHSSIQLTKAWISLLRSNERNFHWTRTTKKLLHLKFIYSIFIDTRTYPNKKSQACRWRRQRQLTWRRVGSEAWIDGGGGETERWEFKGESFREFQRLSLRDWVWESWEHQRSGSAAWVWGGSAAWVWGWSAAWEFDKVGRLVGRWRWASVGDDIEDRVRLAAVR